MLIPSGKTGGGLPGNGVIDRGLPQERATYRSIHWGCTVLEKCSKLPPPKTCVYKKLPFVHSGRSALEVICWRASVVLKEKSQSRGLHGCHQLINCIANRFI